MAFVTVEDLFGSIECVCFPKVYDRMRDFLINDKVVTVKGKISIDAEKAPVIIAESVEEFVLEETEKPKKKIAANETVHEKPAFNQEKSDAQKTLWLNVSSLDEEDVEELMDTLTFYEGETIVMFVQNGKKMKCSQKVSPTRALMAELAGFLSEDCIKLL